MKIIPCGVRGTDVVADPAFLHFGGDTTCFLIEGAEGALFLVDAGSGVRTANRHLRERTGAHALRVLMTHYHLDHVLGFPHLEMLYDPRWTLDVAAPPHGRFSVEHVLSGLADEPLWPVRLKNMPAVIRFTALSVAPGDEGRTWKGITVRWCPVHHPGGCTAYRFDEEGTGASVVIATDLEWAESTPAEQEALLSLCGEPEPAEVLFIDGQFTPAEYERFAGWGHSRWTDAVEIADRSQAEQLRVIHHAPDASDEKLRQVDRDVREALPGASLARQGVAIELGFPSAEAR